MDMFQKSAYINESVRGSGAYFMDWPTLHIF